MQNYLRTSVKISPLIPLESFLSFSYRIGSTLYFFIYEAVEFIMKAIKFLERLQETICLGLRLSISLQPGHLWFGGLIKGLQVEPPSRTFLTPALSYCSFTLWI